MKVKPNLIKENVKFMKVKANFMKENFKWPVILVKISIHKQTTSSITVCGGPGLGSDTCLSLTPPQSQPIKLHFLSSDLKATSPSQLVTKLSLPYSCFRYNVSSYISLITFISHIWIDGHAACPLPWLSNLKNLNLNIRYKDIILFKYLKSI